MGTFKTLILYLLLIPIFLFAENTDFNIEKTLFLMHSDKITEAFNQYQEIFKQNKKHDFELLRKMALILLQQGSKSIDGQIRQLTIFGAGICSSSYAIDILKNGLNCSDPQTQMLSLNFLSQLPDDKVTEFILNLALSSEFLPIRMEAAYLLAEKKHSSAIGIIDSLMHRLPYVFKPYFPTYFALINTPESRTILKNFLTDPNINARIEAVLAIARFNLDDMLIFLRQKAPQSGVEEQEAYAYAFAKLKDSKSIPLLKKMATNSFETTKLAALKALYLLGDTNARIEIEKMAKQNNLFAITILADITGSEPCLYELLKSQDEEVRLNASMALLKRHDIHAVSSLKNFFLQDTEETAYVLAFSPGRTLFFHKAKIITVEKKEVRDESMYISLALREAALREALELPEENFLTLAGIIFDHNQTDLTPLLTALLENHQSDKAIKLLKKNSQKLGAPLIRDYCNLAMFRMKKEGPYEEYVSEWIKRANDQEIIELFTPSSIKQKYTQYQLTPKETSRLLLEMYAALASKQNEHSVEVIIEGIKNAHPKNRYALAGILMKAIQ